MLRGPFIKPKWINIQNPWMSVSHLDGLFKLHILRYMNPAIHPKPGSHPGQSVATQLLQTIFWSCAFLYLFTTRSACSNTLPHTAKQGNIS